MQTQTLARLAFLAVAALLVATLVFATRPCRGYEGGFFDGIKNKFNNVFGGAKDAVGGVVDKAKDAVGGLKDKAQGAVGGGGGAAPANKCPTYPAQALRSWCQYTNRELKPGNACWTCPAGFEDTGRQDQQCVRKGCSKTKPAEVAWKEAFGTVYSSWPKPGEPDYDQNNGLKYAGKFSLTGDKRWPEAEVRKMDIVAVHSKDWKQYKGKKLRVRNPKNGREVVATVMDQCNDADCTHPPNCCTRNAKRVKDNFLVDMEKFTAARLGFGTNDSAVVQWAPA